MPQPAPPPEAPAPAAPSRRHLKLALRIGSGLALLALVVWYCDPRALGHKLVGADPRWFMLALVLAISANVVSAIRWAAIARALGMRAPAGRLILMYARGITTNMLLPGATLSGDLLRTYQLAGSGQCIPARGPVGVLRPLQRVVGAVQSCRCWQRRGWR